MAGIRQFQRRAIELLWKQVFDDETPVLGWPEAFKRFSGSLPPDQALRFFYKRQEIFFLGVSQGIGTCADIHGLNAAVFGTTSPLPLDQPPALDKNLLFQTKLAVFLRPATEDERRSWERGVSVLSLELIHPVNMCENRIGFAQFKNLSTTYCNVC